MAYDFGKLFDRFIKATRPKEIETILEEIGDRPELKVLDNFGPFQWRFYGERDSNISTINLSQKPGRSLVERITNAIDAILEKEMHVRGGNAPLSPMDAAKNWFGRPASSNSDGIFTWRNFGLNDYDKNVSVIILPGDDAAFPTIDIKDCGIGIDANEFYRSILSLQQGNKLTKKYVAGAFGQGGASTLAFSKYTFIASVRHGGSTVAFTIIKKMSLGDDYGEDAYVYLALKESECPTVPSFPAHSPIELYDKELKINEKSSVLGTGTIVRHVGYNCTGFNGILGPDKGNLYHMLNYLMFDPLLPFRLIDLRIPGSLKNELITGSRNRLMSNIGEVIQEGDSGTEIRIHAPREMLSPLVENRPCVGLEYWVALSWRKVKDKTKLRSRSNGLYIDENHPILATLNGQNQGEETARLFKELGLSMVSKHIVVHIDASLATKDVRTNLFTSTREGFKDDLALKEILDVLKSMVVENQELYALEAELLENLLEKETKETDEEVKKEITSLLREAGFESKVEGITTSHGGNGEKDMVTHGGRRPRHKLPPLKTLPYPEVSFIKIIYPEIQLELPQSANRVIRIETDANFRYDREGRVSIRFEPPDVDVSSTSALDGGRKHWRVKAKEGAQIGSSGKIIIDITKPDGVQLSAEKTFLIFPPLEVPGSERRGLVPPFKIIPINPDDDKFEEVWTGLQQDEKDAVAYRYIKAGDGTIVVFYNTAFGPFKHQLESLAKNVGLVGFFVKNYEIWIGYHSILQQQANLIDNDEPDMDKVQEKERALVAEMQVKQAFRTAQLQQERLKIKESQ